MRQGGVLKLIFVASILLILSILLIGCTSSKNEFQNSPLNIETPAVRNATTEKKIQEEPAGISPSAKAVPADISANNLPPKGITIANQSIFVTRVIDGDTLVLNTGETVRLIGINAPESYEKSSDTSKAKLEELVSGKEIRLEKDVTNLDQYGRLLRYVYVGNLFVNLEMVKLGLAMPYPYPPDMKYAEIIAAAQPKLERPQNTSKPQLCNIVVADAHYDAAGDDSKNLNDEYVVFKNAGQSDCNMNGWNVKDAATHNFHFPDYTLKAGSTVAIYTGCDSNTVSKLYWCNTGGAVWNNDGDTIFLKNAQGDLVASYNYQ